MSEKIIGIDIGGTRMRIGLVDVNNQVHNVEVVSSSLITVNGTAVKDLAAFIEEYMDRHGERPAAISIGVPAAVEGDGKTVYYAPNLLDPQGNHVLDKINLVDPLQEEFGIPVYLNKDTNFLLFYDRVALGLEEKNIIVSGYIGTGYGGGVLQDGRLLLGKNGVAMEIGHIPFYHSDTLCGCGKRGCAEANASGTVLRRIWQEHFSDTEFGELFTRHGDSEILRDFVYSCALPFAVMGTIFSPDAYVAGGGVLEMQGFPRDWFEQCIREQVSHAVEDAGVEIYYSEPNQEKGIVGAAIYARTQMEG